MQYSVKQFIEYASDPTLYDPADLILFVLTSDDRVFLPDTVDQSLSVVPGITEDIKASHWFLNLLARPGNKEWADKNLKHAQFIKDNLYHPTINTETLRTLALLRSWASVNSNTMLVISAFNFSEMHFTFPMMKEISKHTQNFFTYLSLGTSTSLLDYSAAEFTTKTDFMKTLCTSDPRLNHFTKFNRDQISKMISDVLVNKTMKEFDLDKLERGVHASFLTGSPEIGVTE